MSRPLKDKDGNIIMCSFDKTKCGHIATRDLNNGYLPYTIPVCQYHYEYLSGICKQIYSYNAVTNEGKVIYSK